MTEHDAPNRFGAVVAQSRIIVCTGTGGVGKTSASAALAVHAANTGRKAVVVTVDPAKRLADALGLAQLTNEPHEIKGVGNHGGSLHALMLDTRATFDGLVTRYSKDREQAERILANRFYQNVAGSLSGTDEYMAAEKLHDLHESGEFELIVVDTPPTRNALAFLDAPGFLTRLLENRVYRILVTPTRGLARTATSAAHLVVRHLTKVVGSDVVDDAIAFFRAFDGMEAGFERRANSVLELLRSDATSFLLVASPRADTIDEARYFATQLAAANITVRGVLVNRVTPRFEGAVTGGDSPSARALADFRALAAREALHVDALRAAAPTTPLVEVPMLPHDIHDLDGLDTLARLIVGAPA